ncbi:hypothetical protein K438DRAFT_1965926 [Mycena galopus ATCC 62051]|nr:hypothetical protein K438DRAFT_1965926 [Mycena galopus ATCC 62051]
MMFTPKSVLACGSILFVLAAQTSANKLSEHIAFICIFAPTLTEIPSPTPPWACKSDSQCQQGCCGFKSGKYAGPDVVQTTGSGGSGRGAKAPKCNVATLLGFKNCIKGAKNGDLHNPTIQAMTAFTAKLDMLKFKPSMEACDIGMRSGEGKWSPDLMKAHKAVEVVVRKYNELDELE